ncbi:MAG: nitronate monooxygenase [Fusobacteriaceae bacterium]|nr:nitronate monooxygenase [Fusobacteriaceae bacterium]MBP6322595.1 nitronate monooxygenase [Fusobacteriaceae bacterium]MBP9510276.1 nitronate monooxygenase [Fusobacteriaceae bacterium]
MKIGNLEIQVPIIQGGMAIRASMSNLAAAVANEGGVGCIAGTAIPLEELRSEIEKAKKLIVNKGGALAVNIMFAATDFVGAVQTSIDAGVDIIITGAGFSRDIYDMVKGTNVKVFPIVSSAKLAKLAVKLGADAIVVEGGNAGGHLGTELDSWDIVADVRAAVPAEIPVFGAGGVITPEDGKRMLALGADGIQMGSRFIASKECEVHEAFKQMYLDAKEGDVVKIMSSAGLPANAIRNDIVDKIIAQSPEILPKTCTNCLKHCTHTFCVSQRLIIGHDGDCKEGLVFAGRDAWKIDSIKSVKEIMDDFKKIF